MTSLQSPLHSNSFTFYVYLYPCIDLIIMKKSENPGTEFGQDKRKEKQQQKRYPFESEKKQLMKNNLVFVVTPL